jgi:Metal binding domain of Ada
MRIIADGDTRGKSLPWWLGGDLLVAGVVVLSATGGFGLGYLAGRDAGNKEEMIIQNVPLEASAIQSLPEVSTKTRAVPTVKAEVVPKETTPASATLPAGGQYVASKNGTKYFLPWCGSAKNIKEENKIWFTTKAEAEAKGYEPAANCKGI